MQLSFGIGIEPLNIVSKMVLANGRPVAKISDAPGKSMCDDPDYLRSLASVYDIVPAAGNPGDDD